MQSFTFSVSLKNVFKCHSIENTVSGEKGRYHYVVLIVSPLRVFMCRFCVVTVPERVH